MNLPKIPSSRPRGPNPTFVAIPAAFPEYFGGTKNASPPCSQLQARSRGRRTLSRLSKDDESSNEHRFLRQSSTQPLLPAELKLMIVRELRNGRLYMSEMSYNERKDFMNLRETDHFFFFHSPSLRPAFVELGQAQLAPFFGDVIDYARSISHHNGSTAKHTSYLSVIVLRIHLEDQATLSALSGQATEALRYMSDLRELQFLIEDPRTSPRFFGDVGAWFKESGTAANIKKIRFYDSRNKIGEILTNTSPWMDSLPFLLELQVFNSLCMLSISTHDLAIPSPLAFYENGNKILHANQTKCESISALEKSFSKDLLYVCHNLKRVYLRSFVGCGLLPPRVSGFWTLWTTDNSGIPFCADPAVCMSVLPMDEPDVCLQNYDYYPSTSESATGKIRDWADEAEENELNNLFKQPDSIHVIRLC